MHCTCRGTEGKDMHDRNRPYLIVIIVVCVPPLLVTAIRRKGGGGTSIACISTSTTRTSRFLRSFSGLSYVFLRSFLSMFVKLGKRPNIDAALVAAGALTQSQTQSIPTTRNNNKRSLLTPPFLALQPPWDYYY